MSVQYSSPTQTTWVAPTVLPSVSIPPGGYFLIQEAAGAGGTTALPTPDAMGTIAMGATAGTVALVANTTPLSGCPVPSANVIDLVGYGGGQTPTDCFEGATGPVQTNPSAALRKQGGCVDSDNNGADFTTVMPPTPRNSMTTAVPCP